MHPIALRSLEARFLMPEWPQKAELVFFNSWALEGFTDVFWREGPLRNIVPEVAVSSGSRCAGVSSSIRPPPWDIRHAPLSSLSPVRHAPPARVGICFTHEENACRFYIRC